MRRDEKRGKKKERGGEKGRERERERERERRRERKGKEEEREACTKRGRRGNSPRNSHNRASCLERVRRHHQPARKQTLTWPSDKLKGHLEKQASSSPMTARDFIEGPCGVLCLICPVSANSQAFLGPATATGTAALSVITSVGERCQFLLPCLSLCLSCSQVNSHESG